MQVVVLAGGQGTRLRPLTYDTPKPLLPVAGRPLVAHLLDRLPAVVDEVLLTVSYRADDLRDWVRRSGDASLDGRTVHVVQETEPLGTAGAVGNCRARIDDTFLVLNGDLLSDVDLDRQLARHRGFEAMATIGLHQVDDPSRYGVVEREPSGRIRAFVEKPAPGEAPSNLANAGAYVLEPEVLDLIPPGRAVSIEREVFPRVAASDRGLYGVPFEGLWIDCGTPASYIDVHAALLEREDAVADVSRSATVAPDAVLNTVWVGPGVRLDRGAHVSRSVILDDATVGADARVVDSIVATGARIGAAALVEDCVVGPGQTVEAGTELRGRVLGLRPEHVSAPL